MDEVIVPIRMRIGDLVIIWQLAQRERRSVGDWIMSCVVEKVERMQEEWRMAQKVMPETSKASPKDKKKGGEK